MTQPPIPTDPGKVIDLRDLPERDVEAVRNFVDSLRQRERARSPLTPEEWRKQFDAYLREVAARADRYPAGFVVDDSRESIYEGS